MPAGADGPAHFDARDAALELVASRLGCRAQRNVALGAMTTYRVGGAAALYARISEPNQLGDVARAVGQSGVPLLIVGRGSNLLVADDGFAGLAIDVSGLDATIDIDIASARVVASAGVALPVLARKVAATGLAGFEWAVGVPGSIGGAVRMNAGGHGSDMAASLVEVTVLDVTSGIERSVPADGLGLGFRSSALRADEVVLRATLQLAPGDAAISARLLSEIVSWRRANQPGGQNAGSVFVNPVPGEVSAGALIDAAGLRGLRMGTAAVSDKHANFIQADPGGVAGDVVALMRHVRDVVEASSGYRLRSEIRLVGFDPSVEI